MLTAVRLSLSNSGAKLSASEEEGRAGTMGRRPRFHAAAHLGVAGQQSFRCDRQMGQRGHVSPFEVVEHNPTHVAG